MKNYKNYICLFLIFIGMSVSQEIFGQVFIRVESVGDLSNGDEVIFIKSAAVSTTTSAMGHYTGTDEKPNYKYSSSEVSISSDAKITLSSSDDVEVFKVKKLASGDYPFAFHNGSGYLQQRNDGTNIEITGTAYNTNPSGAELWSVTIPDGGNPNYYAYVQNYRTRPAGDDTNRRLIWEKAGNPYFGTYLSGTYVSIYKKEPTVMFYQGAGGNSYVTGSPGAILPTSATAVPGWDFIQYWSTDKNWDGDWSEYSKYTYADGTETASGYVYYAVYQGNVTGCNYGDISCKPQAIYSLSLTNLSAGSGVNWVVADVGCGPAGTTVTLTYTINVAGTSYQGATITRDDNGGAVSFVHDAEEQTVTFTFPASDVTAEISFDCPDLTSKTVTINDIVPYYDNGVWKANVTWGAVTGATQYSIQVNDVTGSSTFLSATYQTGTSYLLTGLTEGHTYRAGVLANNPCTSNNSTPLATKDFTPTCPTLTGTLAISKDAVGQTSAAISWGGVTTTAIPTGSGSSSVISYDVSITVEGGAAGGIYSATGTTDTEWSSNSLTTNKTYTVAVRAYNVCGDYQDASTTFKTYNYIDYQFTCADLAWSTPDGTDPIWITSTSGQVVRSQKKLHLTGTGLKPNGAITFTIGGVAANDFSAGVFAIKNKDYTAVAADASGEIDNDVYIFYQPSVATDGLDLNAAGTEIIATSASGTVEPSTKEYRAMSATLANVAINGRHLPSTFVIAAKWGKAWYALPANMTETATEGSNPTPVLIAVDDADAPTMAYCANTNAYNLVPIGGTGTDRFKADGDKVYLGMVNNSNYALFASGHSSSGSENTNIGKSSGQTTSVSGLGVNYQWNLVQTATSVSSTADVIYNLEIASENTNSPLKISRGEGKWGLYSSGISAIRLLPFETIADLALTVEEWGTNEIAVKFEDEGTITQVMIDDDVISPTPSMSLIGTTGSDIKRITGLTGLSDNPMAQFVIQMNVGGSLQQKIMQIPFIVTSTDATTIALRDMTGESSQSAMNEVIKTIDVVVRNGGKLTVNTAEGKATACTFNNLYIYPGGKVDVSGNNLGVKNVYLRGGYSWLSSTYSHPRLKVASGKSITGIGAAGNGIYYDLYANNDIYYMMALPVDVALNTVTNEEGVQNFRAWIKYYNGGNRTGDNSNGAWVNATSITRGVGYEIAIKPRVTGRPYGILRFPLVTGAWSDEATCTPDVTAWGVDAEGGLKPGVSANNAGWNLVGNPFFTAFHNDADGKIVNYGFTKSNTDPWDGKWVWDKSGEGEAVKYFSIPEYTYDDWHDVRAIGQTLEAFYPFYLQVNTTGKLSFSPTNRDLKPSLLRKAIEEREVIVDFQLKDGVGTKDEAGLTISNKYSEQFDQEDKEKTIKSNNYLKVYTIVGEYRTAFNSLPEAAAAQPIPVGYIAPTAGEYTFSLLENADYSDLEHLWLTDGANTPIDLLTQNYSFTTAAGEVNDRFTLNAILKAEETATEIANVGEGSVMNMSVYGGEKHLVVRGLPIGASVWVYDAAGKLVATWKNVSEASVQTDVPASGVYNVRAVYGNDAVTKGAVVR